MFNDIIDGLDNAPSATRFDSAKVRPCIHSLQQAPGRSPYCVEIPLRIVAVFPSGPLAAEGRHGCENLSGKEVKKVYLECGNCFEKVEHETASEFVRKRFNNGSVEFSVPCPTCGYANMVIDLPVDDYEFSGNVFDLSEALNEHDLELVSRYEQGMRLS